MLFVKVIAPSTPLGGWLNTITFVPHLLAAFALSDQVVRLVGSPSSPVVVVVSSILLRIASALSTPL